MGALGDAKGGAFMNGISDLLRRHARELGLFPFLYFLHVMTEWPSVSWNVDLPGHWKSRDSLMDRMWAVDKM